MANNNNKSLNKRNKGGNKQNKSQNKNNKGGNKQNKNKSQNKNRFLGGNNQNVDEPVTPAPVETSAPATPAPMAGGKNNKKSSRSKRTMKKRPMFSW